MTFRDRYFEALGLDPEGERASLAVALERAHDIRYEFISTFVFKSPAATGSVILDRNTSGRTRWCVEGSKQTHHEWQEAKATAPGAEP
jgi:hypothetical protein